MARWGDRMSLGVGLVLAVCLLVEAEAGEVYRWQDGQGRVHYGDRPPLDARAVPRALRKPSVVQAQARDARWQTILAEPSVLAPSSADKARQRGRLAELRERQQQQGRCQKLEQQLDRLRSRQRAGYSVKAGIRMDERRRALKERWQDNCR